MIAVPDQVERARAAGGVALRNVPGAETRVVVADGHVHYYPCFGWDRFLDAAAANFAGVGKADAARCLLFAERSEDDELAKLGAGIGPGLPRRWVVRPLGETGSLTVARAGVRLYLVPGRQIRTAERLEVLALCTTFRVPDGLGIAEALACVAELGALPVVPWGLGKWWFRRGRVIDRLVRTAPAHPVFLGDTSSRPAHARPPRAFRAGWPVLPGTDPLPAASDAEIAGSYGFVVEGAFDADAPAASIRAILTSQRADPCPFGRRRSLTGIVRSQIALRLGGALAEAAP